MTPLEIHIAVDVSALSLWVKNLCQALERQVGAQVFILPVDGDHSSYHPALESLLSLEKMVLRRQRPCWSDRIAVESLEEWRRPKNDVPDLFIDLTSAGIPDRSAPLFRPVFNGDLGEFGLASALFFQGTPHIEIELITSTSQEPVIVADGIASLEAASGLGGAMEAVWSRVLVLLIKVLGKKPPLAAEARTSILSRGRTIRRSDGLVRSGKMLANAAARAAYRLCCHAPHWRIGWRYADASNDVWARRDLGGTPWKILADPIDHFYADPFPFRWRNRDYLFFEDLDHKTQKGIICVAVFDEKGRPGPAIPVLEEPWHLSYPFIIEAAGEVWMIPEASLSGEISLYRATQFPFSWEKHTTLVSGIEAADATIVEHQGRFWMFAVTRQGIGGYSDTLAIWSADTLFGPWHPHTNNPVLINDRTARPAGNMIRRDGHLLRPIQDWRQGYGAALSLPRVTRLDEQGFEQIIETHLSPGAEWPGRKLHTLNGNGFLEVIDGSTLRPKLPIAAKLADWLSQPA